MSYETLQKTYETKEKHMLNFTPQESYNSKLYHLIIPPTNCTMITLSFFLPQLSELSNLLQIFYNTINNLKCGNIDQQKKGAILTVEEHKTNHRKEI